jgi:hypothetical protein
LHQHTDVQIEKDPKRPKLHCLILFGEGVILNNHIFEYDVRAMSTKIVGMEPKPWENEELQKSLPVYGIIICWCIGKKFGGRQFESNGIQVDERTLFD